MAKANGCKGDDYCAGLRSIMPGGKGKAIVYVQLILDTTTMREFNVVQFGSGPFRKKGDRTPMPNWCPFCRGRINKAYYDHCQKPDKRQKGGAA